MALHPRRSRTALAVITAFCVIALIGLIGVVELPRGGEEPAIRAVPDPVSQVADPDAVAVSPLMQERDPGPRWDPLAPPAGRPAVPPTHPDENPHTAPPRQIAPDYVSGVVFDQQVLLADRALPWRYWIDPTLAGRVDEAIIHAAVAAWDRAPGSRWSTSFEGYRSSAGPVADGHSTIFLESECADLTTANAYLFTDGGLGVSRYGTTATQILEADIGICPRITDAAQLERAVRHEVGHVVGLGHLCDPGDPCWEEAMGEGTNACTVMFWQARPCQTTLSEGEQLALAVLYPTVRRLTGRSPDETAARASFAVIEDGGAPLVVAVARDVSPALGAAAAALAGRTGGALLVGESTDDGCLGGAATAEAARTLTRRGTLVLVGAWPDACERLAYDWDITLRRVPGDPVAGSVRLAELGPPAAGAILTAPAVSVAEGTSAAALAASRDHPLLVLPEGPIPDSIEPWLPRGGAVLVVGAGTSGTDALAARGLEVQRLTGIDPTATSLAVADAMRAEIRRGIVLVPVAAGPEALAAAVVAAIDGAVVLAVGPTVDPRVMTWLAGVAPARGWALADEVTMPRAAVAAYAESVG